jgi:integration host factor subunit alpha
LLRDDEGEASMTKADIVDQVYVKTGLSKKESADIVEKVFELVKETVAKGEKIKIAGFGNFVVKEKSTRRGRNPQTGEEIEISSRRILTFKPSQILKSAINRQDG